MKGEGHRAQSTTIWKHGEREGEAERKRKNGTGIDEGLLEKKGTKEWYKEL